MFQDLTIHKAIHKKKPTFLKHNILRSEMHQLTNLVILGTNALKITKF